MKEGFIKRPILIAFLSLCLAFLVTSSKSSTFSPPLLKNLKWYDDNRQRLNEIVLSNGIESTSYNPKYPPVVVFDADDTLYLDDEGDQTFFYMIRNNLIYQPKNKDWYNVSPLLTEAAQNALKKACESQGKAGHFLVTNHKDSQSIACADEISSITLNSTTTSGDVAFSPAANDYFEPSFAFYVQLQAGHTPDEMRKIGNAARDLAVNSALNSMQTLGSTEVVAYIRYYLQMMDLVNVFKNHGFDVWITTASSQFIIEGIAEQYGVHRDHVIGVRTVLDDGKISTRFQACGKFPINNLDIITYRKGKRCWINKIIFGASPEDQLKPTYTITDRFIFSAGDSDTDLFMLKDARHKMAINRNKVELMCHAYFNYTGNWLINPKFIDSLPKLVGGYDCSPYKLPDEEDTVFYNE